MKKDLLLFTILLILAVVSVAKPVYDHKTSYITQLTNFNFRDQVTKIRQNTNYVAIVHFYKYNGKKLAIQMRNHFPLVNSLTNGSTSTMASLGLALLIAINIQSFALTKISKFSRLSRCILLPPFQLQQSLYFLNYSGRIFSVKHSKSCC